MKVPKLKMLNLEFSIFKMPPESQIPESVVAEEYCWIGRSDEELSILCQSSVEIKGGIKEDGWSGIRVLGPLEFSEIGVLARISTILANGHISILAMSTFDTDYIFLKSEFIDKAAALLAKAGYAVND